MLHLEQCKPSIRRAAGLGVFGFSCFFCSVPRRLALSGLAFGTCLEAKYLHPYGTDEFKPILGGRMHTQYPDNDVKRFYTYRNRGYVQSQRGQRRLIPQEWVRFGWYFLVTRRDPAGLREWWRLRRLGRRERFGRFENLGEGRDGRGNR